MDPTTRSISFRNLLLRTLLVGVFLLLLRFVYVFTIRGCDICFFSTTDSFNSIGRGGRIDVATTAAVSLVRSDGSPLSNPLWTTREWRRTVDFYKAVFEDLIAEGYLSPSSKCLSVQTLAGQDVFALKEIGVPDAVGISKKPFPPLVLRGDALRHPFGVDTFDFVFSAGVDRILRPGELAAEICRTLKPEGFLVVHTSSKDLYSLNSFVDLFDCCRLARSREIDGLDSLPVREIVLKKENSIILGHGLENPDGDLANKCLVEGHKRELVWNAEPLITEEPLKPWITLKRNAQNIHYLPSMADLSFKRKYVYIDVGARSYGSSIGSWFKKQYPKQKQSFEIYAIEADRAFHDEYQSRKGVNLVPYAAWVRNETLFFEISRGPGRKTGELGKGIGRGMGRIRPSESSVSTGEDADRIQGFDFANWLKNTVSKKDFVVMKMDVEGTEFDLIPRLFETGAICLIDELFLECHYNRWQRCCQGVRSSKYPKTYNQCLDLFSSLRESGVLVHQWW